MPRRDADYLDPYRRATAEHGPGFDALLWHKPEFQIARFDAIIDMARPDGRTVADLGCGLADLHRRLAERRVPIARYLGVEAVAELAAEAARRVADAGPRRAEIITADFADAAGLFDRLVRVEGADVLAFSGSLNTFDQDHAREILGAAWLALAARGRGTLVFNFLSSLCSPDRRAAETGPARRFDTLAMLAWAAERTPVVALRQDYLAAGHDATIAMHAG